MSDHLTSAELPVQDDIVVLLVDDQPMIGEAIRRALADQHDIDLHYCSTGSTALAIAQQIKPTVILQDLVMPGIDGLTLVREYRASPATKDIPVIVLSSKEDAQVKREAFALGADDYLVKLPETIELLARIRRHSRAYLNQLQRDEAYRALRESQQLLLEKNLELERLINVDGLTGLSNRRYFDEFMGIQWRHAIREGLSFSIMMIDADNFKTYNDTYGHLAGDEVLKRVGEAVRTSCERSTDLAARFGGDEFVVCLSGTTVEGAHAFGEKVRGAVEREVIAHTAATEAAIVTVSVGIAWTEPRRGEFCLPLIGEADLALYEAKRAGKNCVVMRRYAAAMPASAK